MSRYPFREYVNLVMRANANVLAESTLEVMARRFNFLEKAVTTLYAQGKMSTMNPKYMTPEDIDSLVKYLLSLKNRDSSPKKMTSISRDLNELDKLCKYDGNDCIDVYRQRNPSVRKFNHSGRLPVFSDSDFERIARRCEEIDDSDISLLRSYGLLALYLGGGLRTVELQHAKVSDFFETPEGDVGLHLTVVKGMGSYGQPRSTLIIPELVPILKTYLSWRENYLRSRGLECDLYFFTLSHIEMASDNTIRKHRRLAEEDLGISYDGRKCRRSFGQHLKNQEVDMESISKLMGHSNTQTTENYYARISDDMAIDNAFRKLRK